jgi:hypothetical protein
MTYEELKAAYEAAVQKCSELENEIDELKKSNEDKDLHIERKRKIKDVFLKEGICCIIKSKLPLSIKN